MSVCLPQEDFQSFENFVTAIEIDVPEDQLLVELVLAHVVSKVPPFVKRDTQVTCCFDQEEVTRLTVKPQNHGYVVEV